jgi:pyruvate/2-oxoglutarate/acetoin dehydrogenase E1 component
MIIRLFLLNKKLYIEKGPVPEEMYAIPFGQAEIKREGKDITIVATHALVQRSLNAAEQVAKEGIDAEIVDPRTLVPLDKETILNSVKKTGRLLVADEGHRTCGAAAEIAAMVAEEAIYYLKAPIKRVTSPDTPVPFSPPLEQAFIPDEKKLIPAIKSLMAYA